MSNLLMTFLDVLSKIGGVLAAILMLLLMVTVHEFGHYIAGKALGFKITEFAVGFGPAIFKKRSKKTGEKFSVRLLPLGGFCAFDGEDDDDEEYGGYYENLKKQKEGATGEATVTQEGEPDEEGTPDVEVATPEGEDTPVAKEGTPPASATLEERAEIDALFTRIKEEPDAPEKDGENPTTAEDDGREQPEGEKEGEISQDEGQSEPAEKEGEGEQGKKKKKKKEDDYDYPEPKGERFNNQPPWKRIIVLVAGATMNYLLALLITLLMIGVYGAPRYEFYKVPTQATIVTEINASINDDNEGELIGGGIFDGGDEGQEGGSGSGDEGGEGQTPEPQPEMALQVGDVVLEINGVRLYLITDYQTALDGKKAGDIIHLSVLREGQVVNYDWEIQEDVRFSGMSDANPIFEALGVTVGYGLKGTYVRLGFWETIGASFEYSFKLAGVILRSLGELFTGKVGCDSLGGPVTTITATADVASRGFDSYLNMAALIGVNLAIFNLLPVPALDGSKVVFCIIEWIRKKPLNRKVEAIIHFVGIIVIFGFAILVDILHLF